MGIFNEFFKKEKPVFTGLKFGFGSSGGGAAAAAITVSGGTKIPGASTPDGFDYFVFTEPGTLTVTGRGESIDYIVIGGGGGAGNPDGFAASGGGGAGGYTIGSFPSENASYSVTIGAGGAASTPGGDTTVGSLLFIGRRDSWISAVTL